MIRKVLPIAAALAFTFAAAAVAQEPLTGLDKHLARTDFAISGVGVFQPAVSGNIVANGAVDFGQKVGDKQSNSLGALVTLRYIAKPFLGFEGNYGYARLTENYSNISGLQPNIGAQTQVNEYTLGYIVTPVPRIFGFQPYASVGVGSTGFKPTPGGGLGLKTQARATYYYSLGIQQEYFSSHFGLRAGVRQLYYLAPDFGQNFLTIKQRIITTEPQVGFYLKF